MSTLTWSNVEQETIMAVYCASWNGVDCPHPKSAFHADAISNLLAQGVIEAHDEGYRLTPEYNLPAAQMFQRSGLTSEDVLDLVFGTELPPELVFDEVDVITGLAVVLGTLMVFTLVGLMIAGVLSV